MLSTEFETLQLIRSLCVIRTFLAEAIQDTLSVTRREKSLQESVPKFEMFSAVKFANEIAFAQFIECILPLQAEIGVFWLLAFRFRKNPHLLALPDQFALFCARIDQNIIF